MAEKATPSTEDVVTDTTAAEEPVVVVAPSAPVEGATPTESFDPQKHVPLTLYRDMQSKHDKLANEMQSLRGDFDSAVSQAVNLLPGQMQEKMDAVQLGMSLLHYARTYDIPMDILAGAKTPQQAAEIALAYVSAGRVTVAVEQPENVVTDAVVVGGGGRKPPTPPVVSPASGALQVSSGELSDVQKKLDGMSRTDPQYRGLWLELKRQKQLRQPVRVGAIL